MSLSKQRREEIVEALRKGTVPHSRLDAFAVGLQRFEPTLDEDLQKVGAGGSHFKAIRGDYGCGKTFFTRWLADRARKQGFATSEVQISETETPLYKLETVYRRLMEQLATTDTPQGALRKIVDGWFYTLDEDVLAEGIVDARDQEALARRTLELMEQRLGRVASSAPMFSAALRYYREAQARHDRAESEGILAWVAGQPHVAAATKQAAKVRGDIDHFAAMSCLQGVLTVLRDSGFKGLLVVLDEVETIQRMRSDVRDKSLNALRQLIDEIDAKRFPGLYLVVTGTPTFFDSIHGAQQLQPLYQRLHTDFETEARFDNPQAPQIRLAPFDLDRLCEVGSRVRNIFLEHAKAPDRIAKLCGDDYVRELAQAVAGKLGGKVGVAPRVFLKKLVADVLDRIDHHAEFDPRVNYKLTIRNTELNVEEQQAMAAANANDIPLQIDE